MSELMKIFTSRPLYSRAIVFACIGYIFGIALRYIFSFPFIPIFLFLALIFFIASFFISTEKQTPLEVQTKQIFSGAHKAKPPRGSNLFLSRIFAKLLTGQIRIFCCSIFLLFCWLGVWYGAMRTNTQFDNSHVGFYSSTDGTKMTVEGTVARAPQASLKNTKVIIDTHAVRLDSGESHAVQGLAQAFLPPRVVIEEGQEVEVAGVLQKPENFSGFDYQSYLASQGIEALLMKAKTQSARPPTASIANTFHGGLSGLRLYAKNFVMHFIPGQEYEIIAATTLGYGNEISQSLSDTLSRAGIRYIMAISGLHIMVIANLLIALMGMWGFGRRTALGVSFGAILFFGAFIAFPLPALRAILMAGVFYIGQFVGRPLNIFRSLLYAATAILVVNPLLFADVGFQLSFGGLLGILLLCPFFENLFRKIFSQTAAEEMSIRRKIYAAFDAWKVWGLLAMSLSATLFTLPLTLFHFGIVSLWGIIMSIFAIPLLGPLFILTCALIIFGTIASGLGAIIAFPLWAGTHIFLLSARFFSSLPFFIFSADPYDPVILLGSYGALAIFFFVIIRRGYNPLQASIRFFRFDD